MKAAHILTIVLALAIPLISYADEKKFEECRQKLVSAHKYDLLYGLNWEKSNIANPKVFVGPTYYSIPFNAKENFAATVNCFLMAGDSAYINFDLLDWRTGQVVGRYTNGQLKPL